MIRDSERIRASILRLRQQAAWYRNRLQETADKLAVLETALTGKEAANAQQQEKADDPAAAPANLAADKDQGGPKTA